MIEINISIKGKNDPWKSIMSQENPEKTLEKLKTIDFSVHGFTYYKTTDSEQLGFVLGYEQFSFEYIFIDNEYFRCWTLNSIEYNAPYAIMCKSYNEEPPFTASMIIQHESIIDHDNENDEVVLSCYLEAPDDILQKLIPLEKYFMS